MKPITQLFILPAICRALRSRTGIPGANSPRIMQIARRSPSVGFHLLCGFVLASGAANTAFAQNGTYTVRQIVNPIPRTLFAGNGVEMNDLGTVTANTVSDDRSRIARQPFVCLKNGTSKVLPTLPKTSGGGNDVGASVRGISDSGLLVGYSPSSNGGTYLPPRTAYWIPDSYGNYSVHRLDMGSLPPGLDGRVWGLSADGRFALFSGTGSTVVAELKPADAGGLYISRFWQLNSWTGNLGVTASFGKDIHFQPGTFEGEGTVRVVGTCTDTAGSRHCFLWEVGLLNGVEPAETIRDLGPIGYSASVDGVNGTGQAVGYFNPTGGAGSHPTYWNEDGISSTLPNLGGTYTTAASINDAGWVTGNSYRANLRLPPHAFLWHPSDRNVIWDLNTLKSGADSSGIEVTSGLEITNSGHIVCLGLKKGTGVLALVSPAP